MKILIARYAMESMIGVIYCSERKRWSNRHFIELKLLLAGGFRAGLLLKKSF